MSQYPPAFNFVMGWEDPKRQYAIVPDVGGYAISGINSNVWPKDYSAILAAPHIQRAQMVYDFYQTNFWIPMKLGGLTSQDLANRVLDEGVNGGSSTAIKLLQNSVSALGLKIDVDGIMGPDTLDATNAQDPDRIIAWYKQFRLNHYQAIVDNNPQDAKFLDQWEKRAQA
jgi:lysozyme family protein